MDVEAVCDALASSQLGVLSRAQALKSGMSTRVLERRVSSGRWKVALPGVYVPRPVPSSWEQRLMAVVLSGGHTALVSHRSAAALWGLDGFNRQQLEISVKSGHQIPGAIVHRRRDADDPSTSRIGVFAVTSVERTLLDIARLTPPRRLGLALDDALRRRLTTVSELEGFVATLPRGRVGRKALGNLVAQRDELDEALESPLESALLDLLRAHGLPLRVPQYLISEAGRIIARIDFAYPEIRLGIETDGYASHGGREGWAADLKRENRLKLLGWTLLRFTWWNVHDEPELVVAQIRTALRRRSPR